jgi:hypothetical protein
MTATRRLAAILAAEVAGGELNPAPLVTYPQ